MEVKLADCHAPKETPTTDYTLLVVDDTAIIAKGTDLGKLSNLVTL